MAEAAIHALLDIEVVEWINEVCPVEMSVDAEHLSEDRLTDLDKVGGETTALADPFPRAGELREGGGQGGRAGRGRGV